MYTYGTGAASSSHSYCCLHTCTTHRRMIEKTKTTNFWSLFSVIIAWSLFFVSIFYLYFWSLFPVYFWSLFLAPNFRLDFWSLFLISIFGLFYFWTLFFGRYFLSILGLFYFWSLFFGRYFWSLYLVSSIFGRYLWTLFFGRYLRSPTSIQDPKANPSHPEREVEVSLVLLNQTPLVVVFLFLEPIAKPLRYPLCIQRNKPREPLG